MPENIAEMRREWSAKRTKLIKSTEIKPIGLSAPALFCLEWLMTCLLVNFCFKATQNSTQQLNLISLAIWRHRIANDQNDHADFCQTFETISSKIHWFWFLVILFVRFLLHGLQFVSSSSFISVIWKLREKHSWKSWQQKFQSVYEELGFICWFLLFEGWKFQRIYVPRM